MKEKRMTAIIDCEAVSCSYNKDKKCHAFAITVGDEEPCCDTFYEGDRKGGIKELSGAVGACKIEDCEFNEALECTASGIHVILNSDHPDCGTYEPK